MLWLPICTVFRISLLVRAKAWAGSMREVETPPQSLISLDQPTLIATLSAEAQTVWPLGGPRRGAEIRKIAWLSADGAAACFLNRLEQFSPA
jgi:hypothetical protein